MSASASAPAPAHEDTDDAIDEWKDIANHTDIGQYLHDLDEDEPEKETLKKLIHEFPLSLECKNDEGQLPIHSAVWNIHGVGYVPLLAEQGVKYNVGGGDKRGGLLLGDPTSVGDSNRNVLQLLVNMGDTSNPNLIQFDTAYLNTMKDLRDMNLLVKNDIKDHNLLYLACESTSKMRFGYLADWSQDGLKTHTSYEGLPIFHSIIQGRSITGGAFPTFLETSLELHPHEDAGLLFQKDQHGKTAFEYALDKYGKEDTFKVLTDLIPPDAPQFPILHHVAKHAPQYMDDFAIRYPSSVYTLDSFGCTISEDESQGRIPASDNTHTYRINGTRVIGPDRAGLYPFMVAACGNTSDHLSAVYCLLRRDPSLVNGGKRIDQSKNRKRKRRRRDEGVITIEQDE